MPRGGRWSTARIHAKHDQERREKKHSITVLVNGNEPDVNLHLQDLSSAAFSESDQELREVARERNWVPKNDKPVLRNMSTASSGFDAEGEFLDALEMEGAFDTCTPVKYMQEAWRLFDIIADWWFSLDVIEHYRHYDKLSGFPQFHTIGFVCLGIVSFATVWWLMRQCNCLSKRTDIHSIDGFRLYVGEWPILLIEDTIMLIFCLHFLLVTDLYQSPEIAIPGVLCFLFSSVTPICRLIYSFYEFYEASIAFEEFKERLSKKSGRYHARQERAQAEAGIPRKPAPVMHYPEIIPRVSTFEAERQTQQFTEG